MAPLFGIIAGAALAISSLALAQAPRRSSDVRPDLARPSSESVSNGTTAPSDRSAQAGATQSAFKQDQHDSTYRGATTQGTSSSSVAARDLGTPTANGPQLTGHVVRADNGTLWLEHMGAIVPLKLDRQTRVQGIGVKSPRDLREGQEVRASFEVKNKTTNVARSIQLLEQGGTGGSGLGAPLDDLKNTPPDVDSSRSLQHATPLDPVDRHDDVRSNPNGY